MALTTNKATIIGLFQATFARAISGKSPLDAWVQRFEAKMSSGATDKEAEEEILDEMGNSGESRMIYGDQDEAENVSFIFNNSLGRNPTTAGAKAWLGYAKKHTLSELQSAIINAAKNNKDNIYLEEQISKVSDALSLDYYSLSSDTKNGAQKRILLEVGEETVNILDDEVKAQIHNVELDDDTVVLPYDLISKIYGTGYIEFENKSVYDLLNPSEASTDVIVLDAYQEWVDFFFANDKNKIELEWGLESEDVNDEDEPVAEPKVAELEEVIDDSSYEVELKLMYDGGFVKLHDIEIETDILEMYGLVNLDSSLGDLTMSGEVTMHSDNQDAGIFHVDGAATTDEGNAAIEFVGYLIDQGLIDIADV